MVEAGGERLLFDAGRGFMQRLVEAGYPMNAVSKLFLTHLHSDHVLDVPDLMLTPWASVPERTVPLEVRGARGTRAMMRHPRKRSPSTFTFGVTWTRVSRAVASGSSLC